MTQHIGIVGCSAEGAALCYRTICKEGADIFCTRKVLDGVRDVSEVPDDDGELGGDQKSQFLKKMWEQIDDALSDDDDA